MCKENLPDGLEWISLNSMGKIAKGVNNINFTTRRKFLWEILYKTIAIIAIQHGKFILLIPLAIFPILLDEIHSSPSGKFPYTY